VSRPSPRTRASPFTFTAHTISSIPGSRDCLATPRSSGTASRRISVMWQRGKTILWLVSSTSQIFHCYVVMRCTRCSGSMPSVIESEKVSYDYLNLLLILWLHLLLILRYKVTGKKFLKFSYYSYQKCENSKRYFLIKYIMRFECKERWIPSIELFIDEKDELRRCVILAHSVCSVDSRQLLWLQGDLNSHPMFGIDLSISLCFVFPPMIFTKSRIRLSNVEIICLRCSHFIYKNNKLIDRTSKKLGCFSR